MLQLISLAVYALVITLIYVFTLHGPMLHGIGNFLIKFIIAGLGGFVGTAILKAIVASQDKRKREYKVLIWIVTAVSACLAGLGYWGHISYYDGSQIEYTSVEITVFLGTIFGLSLLIRAFVGAVFSAIKTQ